MHHPASATATADVGAMAKDPICGMMVNKATALTSERNGRIYYFCSPACKRTFDDPERELKSMRTRVTIALTGVLALAILRAGAFLALATGATVSLPFRGGGRFPALVNVQQHVVTEMVWINSGARRCQHVRVHARELDRLIAALPPLEDFVLPGGTRAAALAHAARATCRCAERRVVTLSRKQKVAPALLAYLNRLSDLLFVVARELNRAAGCADVQWQQGKNR